MRVVFLALQSYERNISETASGSQLCGYHTQRSISDRAGVFGSDFQAGHQYSQNCPSCKMPMIPQVATFCVAASVLTAQRVWQIELLWCLLFYTHPVRLLYAQFLPFEAASASVTTIHVSSVNQKRPD